MQLHQNQHRIKQNTAYLQSAACRLSTLTCTMREEVASAGLAHVSTMLRRTITNLSHITDGDAYEEFLHDLQGITGIVVLIAGTAPNPPPLWRDLQLTAIELLEVLADLKKARAELQTDNRR